MPSFAKRHPIITYTLVTITVLLLLFVVSVRYVFRDEVVAWLDKLDEQEMQQQQARKDKLHQTIDQELEYNRILGIKPFIVDPNKSAKQNKAEGDAWTLDRQRRIAEYKAQQAAQKGKKPPTNAMPVN